MLKGLSREAFLNETATPSTEALEQLQRELSDRRSIVHFAHAGIAFVVAGIMGGAAGKLFWDSIRLSYLGVAAAVITVLAAGYGLLHYRRASRLLRDERRRFETMKEMRRALHFDDPSALLPQ